MVGIGKLCYVVVVDNEDAEGNEIGAISNPQPNISFWYTRQVLQSVLQLVGCKVNHSFKISRRVFDILERENLQSELKFRGKRITFSDLGTLFENPVKDLLMDNKQELFDLYKKETTVIVKRERFLDAICHSLAAYHYVGPSQRADVVLACRLRERKESMIILLCGTSGCGKSTLSSLLASRLGITTVISTDSIRHMMRSFVDEKDNPLLWASTYHAGEFLDPVSIAEAKARKKDAKLSTSPGNGQFSHKNETVVDPSIEVVGSKVLAVEGYKAQSEMVIDSLDRLIAAWEDRKESVVVEGVHLSLNFVMGLMKKHPSIMPFLIYIADEEKHLERFAVRAKYMTLNPQKNKYVKYIRNIRTIQDYLCKRADKHLVPKVNNTNVDRSVASIHSTIFSCLRRRQMGESLYDTKTNTVKVINEEYCKHSGTNSIGSKGMFRMIQRQDSSRRYVAIVNSDGFVAKAWPFSYADNNEELTSSSACNTAAVGSPIYGPLQVGKTEPVNIQFGNFGIGFWPNDEEGTSYTGNINDSRVDGDEETARFSLCSSSPLHSEGCEKELIEEVVVSESEEEILDEDAGSSDTTEQVENEECDFDGSVIESSTRSDEEYEADQLNERLNGDSVGQLNLHEGFHADQNPNSFSRTLSMRPNGKSSRERRLYKRSHSFPTKKHQSNKPKNASTTESSSAACMDGANRSR